METFSTTSQWLKDAKDLAKQDIACILVGNKLDLKENREVSNGDGAQFAQENGIPFFETSALTGENVHEAFQLLAKNILTQIESGTKNNFILYLIVQDEWILLKFNLKYKADFELYHLKNNHRNVILVVKSQIP